MKYVKKSKK